jgi:hypothetical protein
MNRTLVVVGATLVVTMSSQVVAARETVAGNRSGADRGASVTARILRPSDDPEIAFLFKPGCEATDDDGEIAVAIRVRTAVGVHNRAFGYWYCNAARGNKTLKLIDGYNEKDMWTFDNVGDLDGARADLSFHERAIDRWVALESGRTGTRRATWTDSVRIQIRSYGRLIFNRSYVVSYTYTPWRGIWEGSDEFINYCVNETREVRSSGGRLYCTTDSSVSYAIKPQ